MSSAGLSPGAEDSRLAALREYWILDTPPEPVFDDLTRRAAEVCETPVALMTLVDERRQWFKSRHGTPLTETPREWSFCAHTMVCEDLLIVPDARADARFAQNPHVVGEPHVRFYAGAPLRAPEGHPLGALSVLDHVPRDLFPKQAAALRALGREAQAQLDRRRERFRERGEREISRYEQVLRESEERFRALVELSADVIVLIGRDATFRFVSASVTRVLGYSSSEMIGRSVLGTMHEDDVPLARKTFEYCLEHPGQPMTAEFRYRHRDGAWRFMEVDGVNRLDEPLVGGIVASFRDVTERRKAQEALRISEERFRQLAENVDAVFWMRRLDPLRVLYASPMYERIWGRSVESAYRDPKSLIESIHPDDRAVAAEAMADQVTGYDREYRIVRPDGEVRWIHSRGFPVPDSEGVVIAGISQDITERKRAEEELRDQTDLVANLLALARATTEQPNLERTLKSALEVLSSLTGAGGGSIFLLDEDGQLNSRFFSGGALSQKHTQDEAQLLLEKGLAGWVARRRQPVLIPDTAEDPRWLRLDPESTGSAARSALSVPIVAGGTLTGILTLIHPEPRHFTEKHMDFVQAAGEQLCLALRNAQFVDALGRLAGRQRILNEVLRAAGGRLDPDATLTRAVEAMARRTGWQAINIAVPTEDRRRFAIRASTQGFTGRDDLGISEGIVGRALASGQTQLVPDVSRDPDHVRWTPGTRSELAVPIRHGDRSLGVLSIESEQESAFSPDDVRLAEALSDAVGLALANASLHRAVAAEGERLSALIEASRDGVLMAGGDGAIHVMNEPARRLLGLTGVAPNWLGKPVPLVAQRLRESGSAGAADALGLATTSAEGAREGEFASPAGVVRFAFQAVTSQGTTLGRLLILRDVTEERRVERLREDLSHTMVHDLRSPLTSILGSLEVLERSAAGRDKNILDLASRAAGRLLSLVDAILDVSRLEKGAMPLSLAALDVAELVADAIERERPAQGGPSLVAELPAGLPRVLADPDVIARVLQNLVGNAVKFGGSEVRLSAQIDDAGRSVRISVRDDGPGITSDMHTRIFEKFVTGDHKKRGSGLGLAFCKLAVEAHGGGIRAESVPGQGATFSFTLPAA